MAQLADLDKIRTDVNISEPSCAVPIGMIGGSVEVPEALFWTSVVDFKCFSRSAGARDRG